MITDSLTALADKASVRYQQFTDNLQSIYATALTAIDFGGWNNVSKLTFEVFHAAHVYAQAERDHVSHDIEAIALTAFRASGAQSSSNDAQTLSDAALTHLRETESYLNLELDAQLTRDIARVRNTFQRVVLEIRALARARGLDERRASIEYRIANPEEIQFEFRDRRAHRVPSEVFVRSLWRHALLAVYNEMILIQATDLGMKRVSIVRRDENGVEVAVDTISLAGETGLMTYSEAMDKYFHPNSLAYLSLEAPDV